MSDRAVITFAAAIFERDDLLVLALLDHFASNGRAFDQRRTMFKIIAIADKKHIGKNTFLADLSIKEINLDDVAFGNAVLPTARSDDCESHGEKAAEVHTTRGF